jgi:signal transduction histidine kinase/ActR/RegA family two-component response regulator
MPNAVCKKRRKNSDSLDHNHLHITQIMATSAESNTPTWLNQTIVSPHARRYFLLFSCLFGAGANSLFFTFVEQPGYDHNMNLIATALFWGLALMVPIKRAYEWVCHLAMLTALTLMTYVTVNTGGINSPAMVWMTILPVPALMLLGRQAAFFWMGTIIVVSLIQFTGVIQGWIDGTVLRDISTVPWTFLDKFNVAISLMLAVNFYDRMHNRQMAEVEQRNVDLEATHTALTQAQAHKDEFIASVGHELRTPMNAILGLNGVLQTELADEPENAEIARLIRDSTGQLLTLVNDILDFSQLEAGRLNLLEKPLILEQTLQHVVAPFEQRAKEKGLLFHWSLDPILPESLVLDGHRLQQIMNNLLDNALKFTTQGGIELKATRVDNMIRFEVSDTGRGIARDRQEDVFKQFEHADVQTNRAYGGTGLGLAICERLVSLQGGRIGLQSTLGQGSIFWLELPLKNAEAPTADAAYASKSFTSSLNFRFLLVDDNAVNLMVAKLVLQKCWPNATVTTASSGEQALELLKHHNFDMALMDMIMPGIDGLETTKRLRKSMRPEVAGLVVIGLTANTTPRDKERCLEAGMNDVLSKPMEPAVVQTTIARWAQSIIGKGLSGVYP